MPISAGMTVLTMLLLTSLGASLTEPPLASRPLLNARNVPTPRKAEMVRSGRNSSNHAKYVSYRLNARSRYGRARRVIRVGPLFFLDL